MQIIVNLTDEEVKVVEASLDESIEDWMISAVQNKIRKRRDAIILEKTAFNPKRMSHVDKVAFIEAADPEDIKIYEVVSMGPQTIQ